MRIIDQRILFNKNGSMKAWTYQCSMLLTWFVLLFFHTNKNRSHEIGHLIYYKITNEMLIRNYYWVRLWNKLWICDNVIFSWSHSMLLLFFPYKLVSIANLIKSCVTNTDSWSLNLRNFINHDLVNKKNR